MMSRMLGAPLGGTMRGGHHGFESVAFSLITPPNFGSGAGSSLPSIEIVALGEPGAPVICWARTAQVSNNETAANNPPRETFQRADRSVVIYSIPTDFVSGLADVGQLS